MRRNGRLYRTGVFPLRRGQASSARRYSASGGRGSAGCQRATGRAGGRGLGRSAAVSEGSWGTECSCRLVVATFPADAVRDTPTSTQTETQQTRQLGSSSRGRGSLGGPCINADRQVDDPGRACIFQHLTILRAFFNCKDIIRAPAVAAQRRRWHVLARMYAFELVILITLRNPNRC